MQDVLNLYHNVPLNAFIFIMLTVMEVQSVNAGYTENVKFPSEDDSEQAPAYRKERIFLPEELFEKKGMKILKWPKLLVSEDTNVRVGRQVKHLANY